jgi:hypothetical protein
MLQLVNRARQLARRSIGGQAVYLPRLTEAVQKLGILFRGRSLQTAPRTDFGRNFVCS